MRRAIILGVLAAAALAIGGCSSILGIGDLPEPDSVADEAGIDGAGTAPPATSDAAPSVSPDAGSPESAAGCDISQCQAQLISAAAVPANCAEAYCDVGTGACAYRAKDADGDGHRAATCHADGLTIVTGDDCDDGDKSVFPGQNAECSDLPDGGTVQFPGGHPTGTCAYGAKQCKNDGTFAACAGVKPPGKVNCTSSADNDCDGKADNTECGVCVVNTKQSCYTGPAGTQGVGPCHGGTQTCTLDASGTSTAWGPCTGQVLPSVDTCDPGNDNSCNGKANDNPACKCLNGQTSSCGTATGARGACANGTTTCSGGNWGACSIQPAVHDTCVAGNDNTCNGVANESCTCLDQQKTSCGTTGTGCTAGTETCSGTSWPGTWGACLGNTCNDFQVNMNVDNPCGPQCFNGTTCNWSNSVCGPGYHVTSCSVTNTGGHGSCIYDGPSGGTAVWHGQVSGCDGTHCVLQWCDCRRDGF